MLHTPGGDPATRRVAAWWTAWCAAVEGRLRRGKNPFGIVPEGTLSGFALGGKHDSLSLEDARHFVAALALIQTGKPVSVEYATGMNCTDLLSGQIFLDPGVMEGSSEPCTASPLERLDVLAGLALHEAGHHDFSSPELSLKAKQQGDLFGQLFNLLDDEYVEQKVSQGSPGYTGYLWATRHFMFRDKHREQVGEDHSLLNACLLCIRYPWGLSWPETAPYREELGQICHILTPFLQTEEEVYRATERIYDIVSRAKGPEPSAQLYDFLKGVADHQLLPSRSRTARTLLKKLGLDALMRSAVRKRAMPSPDRDSEANVTGEVTWETPAGDRTQYERDRAAVRPYIVHLRRWLSTWEIQRNRILKGKRAGTLDRQKLYSVAYGNEHIFQKQQQGGGKDLAIVLLIDESGSMGGAKIDTARQVAVLCKEALAPMPGIDLFIYGHTADQPAGTTNLLRYWTPGRTQTAYGLGAIQARLNNRDGVAIQAVAQEVKRLTRKRQIVMLVTADGMPAADGYGGEAAIAHTRQVVDSVRPLHIVHIGIDASLRADMMFAHRVRFTNLQDLPRQMSRLLQRLLSGA